MQKELKNGRFVVYLYSLVNMKDVHRGITKGYKAAIVSLPCL